MKGERPMTNSNLIPTLDASQTTSKSTTLTTNRLWLLFGLAFINGLLLKFAIAQGTTLLVKINYLLIGLN
jgi:hypothetical protein